MRWSRLSKILAAAAAQRPFALMGFDGFVDTVGRPLHGDGQYFSSMASLGDFLSAQGEKNCALEVSRSARKMGGNAPISAHALAAMGIPVACVGALGQGAVEPAFQQMDPLCSLYPVAMPGECLALEFCDSKLFLADMSGPRQLSWEGIKRSVGLETLTELADRAELLGLFNWGSCPTYSRCGRALPPRCCPGWTAKSARRYLIFRIAPAAAPNPSARRCR